MFSINNNIINTNNSFTDKEENNKDINRLNNQYEQSKLKKYLIINKIKKQIKRQISETFNNNYDIKNHIYFENEYIVIPDNILNIISPKQCRNYDIYNIYIYNKNIKLYNNVMKKINNSGLTLTKMPNRLPQYSNLERQYMYKQRNKSTNNLLQTKAILYLLNNNYKLIDDITSKYNNENNKDINIIYFESHQALNLAKELSHIKGDNLDILTFEHLINYNLFNNNNKDINSIILDHEQLNIQPEQLNIQPEQNIYSIKEKNVNIRVKINKNNNINKSKISEEFNTFIEPSAPINNMLCLYPEHHNVNDKIVYYENK